MEHEHIYPVFRQGRIMKKELLLALREYSYETLWLQYRDYPDGIISGCGVRAGCMAAGLEERERDDSGRRTEGQVETGFMEWTDNGGDAGFNVGFNAGGIAGVIGGVSEGGNTLHIMPGIIKCGGFIFLIPEENTIQYQPSMDYTSLKFRLIRAEELADYVRYRWEFALDGQLRRKQGEIELCRFKLKEGAVLRTDYKDFYDIQTEYDTVNLADATWSSPGGHTLSKEITDFFARKVLECGCAQEGDVQFAYFLLQSKEAVNPQILMDYIARKSGGRKPRGQRLAKGEMPGRDEAGNVSDTVEMFGRLAEILEGIRNGGGWDGTGEAGGDEGMIVWE